MKKNCGSGDGFITAGNVAETKRAPSSGIVTLTYVVMHVLISYNVNL